MTLSRYLGKFFRTSSTRRPNRERNQRRTPTVETLEERVTPSIWVVGELADNGNADTLRYILDRDAKPNDYVVFASPLYANATGQNPAKLTLANYGASLNNGLAGGPLTIPADVAVLGPPPDTSRGFEQPLIEIDGSNLKDPNQPFKDNVVNVVGTSTNSFVANPSALIPPLPPNAGGVWSTQDSPGPHPGTSPGYTVLGYLTVANAQVSQAGVYFSSGTSAYLWHCTVESCASTGIYNADSIITYIYQSFITSNGGQSSTSWGGAIAHAGYLDFWQSTVANNGAGAVNFGGGITSQGAEVWVENSTVTGNTSSFGGAGIFANGGVLHLNASTIAKNITGAKGGGVMFGTGKSVDLQITNTIIAENSAGASPLLNDLYLNGATLTKPISPGNTASRFNVIGVSDPAWPSTFWDLTWNVPPTQDLKGITPEPGTQILTSTGDNNAEQLILHLGLLSQDGGATLTIPELYDPYDHHTGAFQYLSGSVDNGDDLNPPNPDHAYISSPWGYYWSDEPYYINTNNSPIPLTTGGTFTDQRDFSRGDDGLGFDVGAYEYQAPGNTVAITTTTIPSAQPSKLYGGTTAGGGYTGVPIASTGGMVGLSSFTAYNVVLGASTGGNLFLPNGPLGWLSVANQGTSQPALQGLVPSNFTGTYTFTVTVSDQAGNVSAPITYTISTGALVVTPGNGPLPPAVAGSAYSTAITATGSSGNSYTFQESNLPGWLTATPSGGTLTLTGNPTVANIGNYSFTVTVNDAQGDPPVVLSYTVAVNPALSFTPATNTTLPTPTTNTLYTVNLTPSGGTETGYTFSASGAQLPAWLHVSGNTLTGTPTATGGGGSFQVTLQDSRGPSSSITYTYTIPSVEKQITFTSPSGTSLPTGTSASVYAGATFTATGGSSGGKYYYSATGLPSGLSLNSTSGQLVASSILGGSPAQWSATPFNVTITAKDQNGATGSKTFTLLINKALALTPSPLPIATVGNNYGGASGQLVTPGGGSGGPYTVTYVSGLPSGLSFSSATDRITGSPLTVGNYTVVFSVQDGTGGTAQVPLSLHVDSPLLLTTNPSPIPYAAKGGPYNVTLATSGGSGSGYTYQLLSGTLPPGVSLVGNKLVNTSTLTASSGTYTFTVQVTDSVGGTGQQTYTITAEGPITITPPSLIATVSNAYSQSFTAGGTTGPYTFVVSVGTGQTGLPATMTLNANGTLSGTPTQAGTYTFTVTATDSNGGAGSKAFTLIVDPALSITPVSPLPSGAVGSSYSVQLTGHGGNGGPYTFTGSNLPAWLTLSNTGLLSSTTPPSSTATYTNITITAKDSTGATVTQTYSLTVNPPISVGPATLPSTAQYDTYYQPLAISGGAGAPYMVFVTAGALPSGIGISGTVLTGQDVTATPRTYFFTLTVKDVQGAVTSQNYSITVGPPVNITPTSLPAGTMGNSYSQTLTAQAGSGSGYVFTESGALPAGLSLTYGTGTLTISGTPSQYGTFPIQVSVTDGKGGTTSQTYTLAVNFSLGNSPNGKYVYNVYEQLLHRAPDPSAQYWVNLLNKLGPSVAPTIVAGVEASVEYLSDWVSSIYLHYLGRNADAGATAWVNALAGGESFEAVAASIVASAEYYADHGNTNTGFVSALYKDVLGRAADSAGLNSLVGYLNAGGSRFQAALGLLTSTEYHQDLVGGGGIWNGSYPIYPWAGYYMQFLHRGADAGGLAGWTGTLNSGVSDQQVLAAIFGSAEAFAIWD